MTGADVSGVRERLGLTTAELAGILCVQPSTVYRWEAAPAPAIDPLYRQLVLQLYGLSVAPRAVTWGKALKEGLKVGPTYALHVLLAISFNHWAPPNAT
jgi:transcriptional regulator with XRE-family HTH domain